MVIFNEILLIGYAWNKVLIIIPFLSFSFIGDVMFYINFNVPIMRSYVRLFTVCTNREIWICSWIDAKSHLTQKTK